MRGSSAEHLSSATPGQTENKTMSKIAIYLPLALTAALGNESMLSGLCPYRVGVTPAKPHDPERLRKAEERRARRAAKRAELSSPNIFNTASSFEDPANQKPNQ